MMKRICIDVVFNKRANRFLTADLDSLYLLRDTCGKALDHIPRSDWPLGKDRDQIIDNMVSIALDLGKPDVDIQDVDIPRSDYELRLVTPRAKRAGVTAEWPK